MQRFFWSNIDFIKMYVCGLVSRWYDITVLINICPSIFYVCTLKFEIFFPVLRLNYRNNRISYPNSILKNSFLLCRQVTIFFFFFTLLANRILINITCLNTRLIYDFSFNIENIISNNNKWKSTRRSNITGYLPWRKCLIWIFV